MKRLVPIPGALAIGAVLVPFLAPAADFKYATDGHLCSTGSAAESSQEGLRLLSGGTQTAVCPVITGADTLEAMNVEHVQVSGKMHALSSQSAFVRLTAHDTNTASYCECDEDTVSGSAGSFWTTDVRWNGWCDEPECPEGTAAMQSDWVMNVEVEIGTPVFGGSMAIIKGLAVYQ